MSQLIQEQRKNIDQFYDAQRATITDLYRISQFTEQREKLVAGLEKLFKESKNVMPDSTAHIQILSQIVIDTEILRAANREAQEYIKRLQDKVGLQNKISGRMIELKKKMNVILPQFDPKKFKD